MCTACGFFIMPKRFTDTDKWKKPFIRSLKPEYKLLWLYILDDCDRSGIWDVDIEVAALRIGCRSITEKEALAAFGKMVHVFADGRKWFVVKFPHFQYRHLKPSHSLHKAVIDDLTEYDLYRIAQEHLYEEAWDDKDCSRPVQ